MAESLGKSLVVTGFGESHGRCVGAVVDGCPAGLALDVADIQQEMDKRRPGLGAGATPRSEQDKVEILSGVFNGRTTGAPICMLVWNLDTDSAEYERTRFSPRPGHADYSAFVKYGGFNDFRGGGRFSGRMTAQLVMAGAIAKRLVKTVGMEVLAHTVEIAGIVASPKTVDEIRRNVGTNPLRCADQDAAGLMADAIEKAKQEGDSVGGVVECVALNVPAGLGEPIFDSLDGDISKAVFAIPAVKGVEFGSGFSAARKRGSENNDPFVVQAGRVVTESNNAGGILGGMSSGMPIVVRVAFKPTPSIARSQQTVDLKTMTSTTLAIRGRHDTCVVPRAVPAVESAVAITLADFALRSGIIPRVIR